MKKFKIEEADMFLSLVGAVLKDSAKKGLLSAAIKTVNEIQTSIIPSTIPIPVDRGIYNAAWKAEVHADGAIVYNDAPHASIIENGAAAKNVVIGAKLITALVEWIKRKGIGGTTKVSKSGITRVIKATTTEATAIAFAIAKNMQKTGMFKGTGLKVFERVSHRIPRYIQEEVSKEITKISR